MGWNEKVEIERAWRGKEKAKSAACCKYFSYVFILSWAITESLRKLCYVQTTQIQNVYSSTEVAHFKKLGFICSL